MDAESIRTRPISTEVSGSAFIRGGGKNRTMREMGAHFITCGDRER